MVLNTDSEIPTCTDNYVSVLAILADQIYMCSYECVLFLLLY